MMAAPTTTPEPQPCEVCGKPIIWAMPINNDLILFSFGEGRETGGVPMVWNTTVEFWVFGRYRRHDLGKYNGGQLVYPQHRCPAAARNAWQGSPEAWRSWKPSGRRPFLPQTVDGLPDPFDL